MKKRYPRLTEMGVLHPEQIVHYVVNSIDYVDFLRIVYERPKGSVLPVTRNYEFPRVQKKLDATADGADAKVVMESDPAFREALEELETLCSKLKSKRGLAAEMLEELTDLEEEFGLRSARLKTLIRRIKTT